MREVEHRYRLIGRSPLTEITLRQARRRSRARAACRFTSACATGGPTSRDTVRKMAEDGITHAVVICLAPHNSRTSVGLYRRALAAIRRRGGVFHSRLISSRAGTIIRC